MHFYHLFQLCRHVRSTRRKNNAHSRASWQYGKLQFNKELLILILLLFQGTVIALDRSATKIRQIEENARKLGLQNIRAFVMDATKSCRGTMLHENEIDNLEELLLTPPFPCQFFDRILLDAPCSGVGQRPQLYNTMKLKEFLSFPKLQKKLISTVLSIFKN